MRIDKSFVNKSILSLMLCFAFVGAAAQEQTQQQQQRNTIDSIDVIRDYRPILADAVKIRRSPDMTNKREYQPKLSYSIIDKKLDITTGTRRLAIQEMPYTDLTRKTSNYVKLGAGNYSTYLGEIYLSNDDYLDTRFGVYAKHLSQKGDWADQNFSQQELTAFGTQEYERFSLSGNIGYKRNGTRFYGQNVFFEGLWPTVTPTGTVNVAKQTFNDIFLDGELTSKSISSQPEALAYSVKINGYLYSDAFEAKENSFAVSAYLDKKISNFHVGAHISGDFNQVNGQNYTLGNHIARLNPYVRLKGEQYDLVLGAMIASEMGDSSRFNIFPKVSIDFALIPTYAHLFGGVEGDVLKTSLKALAQENPWLRQNIGISNALNRFRVYGGLKGNAGATFGYKVTVDYRQIENMPFFMAQFDAPYLYHVIYENGSKASSVFGIEGEVNLRVSETVALGGRLNFNEYDLQTEEEAWFKPKFELAASTRINISDRLYLDGELQMMGQSYAQVISAEQWNSLLPHEPYPGPFPTFEKTTIPAYVDLSAGLEFRATDEIGIYVRANNLLNTQYERYLHYPRLGLNVIGGVNFSF